MTTDRVTAKMQLLFLSLTLFSSDIGLFGCGTGAIHRMIGNAIIMKLMLNIGVICPLTLQMP
ncbi:hypothetical protein JCM17042A_09650 [Ruminococcus champanellensis 18P13 = JCM 17042]